MIFGHGQGEARTGVFAPENGTSLWLFFEAHILCCGFLYRTQLLLTRSAVSLSVAYRMWGGALPPGAAAQRG